MLTRALLIGAIAAAPAIVGIVAAGPASAKCTAAIGSLNDGICLDQNAPAPPQQQGVPSVNFGGPGQGITTSPLFPGQTFTTGLG